MFGIGGFELVLILVFGFLVFGPDKLPAIAKTVAQALNKFRSAQQEMNKVIKTEVYDPNSEEPFKNPLDVLSKVSGTDKKEAKTESFSERKAKYDRERAVKKRAEDRAASKTEGSTTGAVATGAAGAAGTVKKASEETETAKKPEPKTKPNAAELYGNTPRSATKTKPAVDARSATTATAKPTASKAPASKTAATKSKTSSATSTAAKKTPSTKPAASATKKPAASAAKKTTPAKSSAQAAKKPAARPASSAKASDADKASTQEKGE